MISDQQFANLASYAQVLGTLGEFYWLGYEYASTDLQDVDGNPVDSESPILDAANLGAEQQQDPGSSVCVAIGGDGKIYRILCAEEHPSFCYLAFQGKY